ncbi:peroxide stress protein YaaA [Xylanimonas oleitrophica]|uniref:Peroxide stress protein YaaA n=1 Tax=Xylanimonas oleitrophica TaxID=2607479 RepID=A0A2W5WSV7_9MICO|nr:peroxide stress protein YaaA [Xylanimonas oleitrophica]PZR53723.1 peroxide stress protein YaaA [Xylanimonas oleitrophica]
MLLLLPPSEGKTPAPDGAAPVDLAALTAAAELTPQRTAVLDALAAVSARPDATTVLGVGDSLAAEVERNTRLRTEPAGPAAHVYTGVLYAAADLAALTADAGSEASARAAASVRIFSGLWGMVAPADRVPAYRLSGGVDLPGVGKLSTAWRGPLSEALDARAAGDVVVDCRSATYVAAWKPRTTGPDAAEWVTVRVVREAGGKRTVVSHNAKHTRGVLAGHLLRREAQPPTSADELARAAGELVGQVVGTEVGSGLSYRMLEATLHAATSKTAPQTLELVVG